MTARARNGTTAEVAGGDGTRLRWWAPVVPVLAFLALLTLLTSGGEVQASGGLAAAPGSLLLHVWELLRG